MPCWCFAGSGIVAARRTDRGVEGFVSLVWFVPPPPIVNFLSPRCQPMLSLLVSAGSRCTVNGTRPAPSGPRRGGQCGRT